MHTQDAVMRDEWLCDLKTSTALPPAEPPMRGKTRQKMSLGTRAQRNIAGRVGVTTFGKAMGKAAANEEVGTCQLLIEMNVHIAAYILGINAERTQ